MESPQEPAPAAFTEVEPFTAYLLLIEYWQVQK